MFNKRGMEIDKSAQAVQHELLSGTKAVMADGAAIFVEHSNVKDQKYIVSQNLGNDLEGEVKRFSMQEFSKAWQRFLSWSNGDNQP